MININALKRRLNFKCNLLITILAQAGFTLTAAAQISFYQPFSIGAGYGVTLAHAGEQTLTSNNAVDFNLNYNITPFVSLSLEAQTGKLSSGDAVNDEFPKQFTSNFNAVMLHADLQLGELMDFSNSAFLNGLKNVYFGTGAGLLFNKITYIQGVNPNTGDFLPFIYAPKSTNLLVPLRAGYEFKIFNKYNEPQFKFDIAYSFNTAFDQGMDGYIVPGGTSLKFYDYLSVGLKYSFGGAKAYRKEVSYNAF